MLAGTTPEGLAFLAAKEKEAGVVKTASGLLYKVIQAPAANAKQPRVSHKRLMDALCGPLTAAVPSRPLQVNTPCSCHVRSCM